MTDTITPTAIPLLAGGGGDGDGGGGGGDKAGPFYIDWQKYIICFIWYWFKELSDEVNGIVLRTLI